MAAQQPQPLDANTASTEASFRWTAKQEEAGRLLAGPATHILLAGGGRSGKSARIVRQVIMRALKAPGSRHLITRLRFNHLRASIVNGTFPWVMEKCFPGVNYKMDRLDWFATVETSGKPSQIWFCGLDEKERTEKVLGMEFCVHPDTRVLMADLTWKRAVDVAKGDELVAFPEELEGHMKLVRSKVEFNKQLYKKRYRVVTTKGTTIVSEGHKFVTYFDDRRVRNFRPLSWRSVEELSPGDKLRFATAPWTTDKSYEGGWMAGLYDGEGWLSSGAVGVGQNPGPVLEKARSILADRGIALHENNKEGKNGKCRALVASSLWDSMRAVGSLRPTRLIGKSSDLWEGRYGFNGRGAPEGSQSRHQISTNAKHVAEILSIEQIDDGEVRAIQTSSKTYIADGFLAHNCTIFPNECSQIPYSSILLVRTRLAQKIAQLDGNQLPLKMFYDENPPSKAHWSYKLFIKHQDPDGSGTISDHKRYAYLQMNPIDNAENLPAETIEEYMNLPGRMRKRFWDGEFGEVVENALFPAEMLDANRVDPADVPDMLRVVVGVDPMGATPSANSASTLAEADRQATGIMVAGLGVDGNAYWMEDCTVSALPSIWGKVAVDALERHDGDRIIGEVNYGGTMVEHTIRTVSPHVAFRTVRSTRGKHVRAEPVSALMEKGKVRIVGHMRRLEDELEAFSTMGYMGDGSPNRADAAIFTIYDLFASLVKAPKAKDAGRTPLRLVSGGRNAWMG